MLGTNILNNLTLDFRFNSAVLNKLVKVLINLVLFVMLVFIVFYLLVIIFYKYSLVIPNFINFNLINLTILLFSVTSSNTILDKNLIEFLIFLNKINMNGSESDQYFLKIQEKYFLKYENTYFLDKKCSEN